MALKNNHTLKVLSLSCNEISDTGAKEIAIALKDNRNLIELSLASNQITDAGAKDLPSHSKTTTT
jgi:Ran GTPase-activating protein (RanGAP) involved in mRNA processing and transport